MGLVERELAWRRVAGRMWEGFEYGKASEAVAMLLARWSMAKTKE
jgi:hypothetical protein